MKKVFAVLFMVYIVVLLKLTVFRVSGYSDFRINVVPFIDLLKVYKNGNMWQFIRLFAGNIIWFLPFGFLLPCIFDKMCFLKTLLLGFSLSFGIELIQLIFKKGVFETDDLILNTFGTAVGYIMFKAVVKAYGIICK